MNIHWRLGELWLLQQKRQLTEDELLDMNSCMQLNATYARKLAEQYNYGLMASMTNDWDWLHEVSAQIDRLEELYDSNRPSFFEKGYD
ncbi:DUF7667 family protein [Paenibacillus castaneae]|uniref:DUF7667 family protein n=1 Tax=Paenibacillus castaneae TaxID=474957 RepID=UPI003C7B366A